MHVAEVDTVTVGPVLVDAVYTEEGISLISPARQWMELTYTTVAGVLAILTYHFHSPKQEELSTGISVLGRMFRVKKNTDASACSHCI